jgi:Fe-S-cluster containining protein
VSFRVDFHSAELVGGAFPWDTGVPPEMTVPLTARLVRMAGTDAREPRCVALSGEIGRQVSCRIYAQRPSPCREFDTQHDACNRARQRCGLERLVNDAQR